MPASRLFTRDFTLMTVGQIISLFGNAILRFALSLHVLALTGSAAVFGGILALSMVPTALLSPLGGILADRMPRARIMVILDFSTCAFILLFDALFARSGNLGRRHALHGASLPSFRRSISPLVQASVPTLVAEERLTAANGVVLQVQALTGLLRPVLGGILMGFFGIYPILAASAGCFFSAPPCWSFFFTSPLRPSPAPHSPFLIQARDDLAKPRFSAPARTTLALLRLLGNRGPHQSVFSPSLFTVGLPHLVKCNNLGLSDQLLRAGRGGPWAWAPS
ncbi:MAG: MFS transporter [Intestinimonas sp.]